MTDERVRIDWGARRSLPAWDDPWIALALRTPDGTTYVTVWRRPGTDESAVLPLPLPGPQAAPVRVDVLYPASTRARTSWRAEAAELRVTLPAAPSAVVLRLSPDPDHAGR